MTKDSNLCEKHFRKEFIYKPPGGTQVRLLDGARPALCRWNNFTFDVKERKAPRNRQSETSFVPRKRLRLGLKENESQRTSDEDFENNGSDHEASECNSNRPTPLDCTQEKGVSITNAADEHFKAKKGDSLVVGQEPDNDLWMENSLLRKEIEDLKFELKKARSESLKSEKKINIVDHVMSSNKTCKHYTGFPTIKRLKEVDKFLNSGENGENVILYHNQDIKVEELGDGRGRKRAFDSFEAFLLTLVRCRCNFSVTHLAHLFETTESTVSTTFITWINFLYLKLGIFFFGPLKNKLKRQCPSP